ncbi:MAG: hypothetical protein R6U98_12655 [Pirellulaceae bacterium]
MESGSTQAVLPSVGLAADNVIRDRYSSGPPRVRFVPFQGVVEGGTRICSDCSSPQQKTMYCRGNASSVLPGISSYQPVGKLGPRFQNALDYGKCARFY